MEYELKVTRIPHLNEEEKEAELRTKIEAGRKQAEELRRVGYEVCWDEREGKLISAELPHPGKQPSSWERSASLPESSGARTITPAVDYQPRTTVVRITPPTLKEQIETCEELIEYLQQKVDDPFLGSQFDRTPLRNQLDQKIGELEQLKA